MGNIFKLKKQFIFLFVTITTLSVLFTNCSNKLNSQIGLSTSDIAGLNFKGVDDIITFTHKPKQLSNQKNETIDFAIGSKWLEHVARVEFKLNNDDWLDAGGTQILLTDMDDGQQYVTVRAISNDGSMSDEQGYSWIVDAELPVAEISVKPEATIASNSTTIEFATNETVNYFATCWLNGIISTNCTSPVNLTDLTDLTDYEFKVQITDAAGNKSEMLTTQFRTTFIEPKFSVLSVRIFNQICAACHNPTQRAGTRDFTNYAGVVAAVTPENAMDSRIYIRITGSDPLLNRMPLGRPPLSDAEISAIKAWINAGALDN